MLDAKADLELKKVEFRRNQALYERNAVVSAEARDTAETNLKRAQATYERAIKRTTSFWKARGRSRSR